MLIIKVAQKGFEIEIKGIVIIYYKYINANKDKQQLFVELMINQTIIF
jgi:hypothetical protein